MKRVLLLSALFGLSIVLNAQKVYFIYLQSETSAPFYVKMAGKIQSSTTEGYLIIPKLTDSTYLLSVGQPGKAGEPKFSITISRGDRGFLIKDFDGSPGLFDLQTLAVYRPLTAEGAATQTVPKNDNFTRLLAKAADDTTLLSQPVVVQEQKPRAKEPKTEIIAVKEVVVPKKDTVQQSSTVVSLPDNNLSTAVVQKDTSTIFQKDAVAYKPLGVALEPVKDTIARKEEVIQRAEEPVVQQQAEEEYKRAVISKKSESSTSEGFGLVFTDTYNGMVDTIQLVIPNQKIVVPETTQKQPTVPRQFLEIAPAKADSTKKDTASEVKKDTEVKIADNLSTAKLKSQCATLATDDDFFKLRKDMVSKNTDDEMIAQAKRYFRAKCYRTEQIKFLSNLFLSDEGKYQFFDAAYIHVSDQERFIALQSELKDSYYINRFKALIGK